MFENGGSIYVENIISTNLVVCVSKIDDKCIFFS